MDYTQLVRDKSRVLRVLQEQSDGSVVATGPLEIHFPKRFIDKSFASLGQDVESIMVLGLVVPSGHYCNIMSQAEVTMSPTNVRETTIDSVRYVVLEFEKGDTVFQNLTVVRDEHLNNPFYKEFTYYGRVPWYVSKKRLPAMFDNSRHTTGRNVGSTPQVFRVLYALINRDPEDLEKPYRYSTAMLNGKDPQIVGLNNGSLLIDGTFNRLMGGYLADNTNAAILKPDTRITDAEKVMKGVPD